jgi:hypothetical protein
VTPPLALVVLAGVLAAMGFAARAVGPGPGAFASGPGELRSTTGDSSLGGRFARGADVGGFGAEEDVMGAPLVTDDGGGGGVDADCAAGA